MTSYSVKSTFIFTFHDTLENTFLTVYRYIREKVNLQIQFTFEIYETIVLVLKIINQYNARVFTDLKLLRNLYIVHSPTNALFIKIGKV